MGRSGCVAHLRPWTAEEDALLRASWGRPADELAPLFPGRSRQALYSRAHALRIAKPAARAWTSSEDNHLRDLWGEATSLGRIGRILGRSKGGVYERAKTIGLPLGAPAGWEYLWHAATRTGYTAAQLRRILRWAGVPVHRALANPNKPTKRGSRLRWIVESFEVDEAVERWLKTEPAEVAARRLGVCPVTLRLAAHRLGVPKAGGHLRVTDEQARAAAASCRGQNWREAA